ncbi:MAG: hypothetical protein K2W93_06150, partial [Burkholderiaceae bacterium]|nr:hypothetical protein [Burkholderiaceae bacterium]
QTVDRVGVWSIAETRQYVANQFGQAQLELVTPSLNALAKRQDYARYHYQEVLRLLGAFQHSHLSAEPLLMVVFGEDRSARGEFELVMTQIGAHALACVMSIHAIADVMAFAIHQTLGYGLRPSAPRERDVSAQSVQAALQRTPAHIPLAELLAKLCADPNYKHVAALANKSKHQGLVKPSLNEDMLGTRQDRHQVRFLAFKHGSKFYPETELGALLEPAYKAASQVVVDVGNQLNAVLAMNAVKFSPNAGTGRESQG